MPANIEFPLDLPEVRILKSDLTGREIIITVESTRTWAICPKCGKRTEEFHSFGRQLRLRHLPILGRPVIIEIRPRRFRCHSCEDHPTTTQKLDWYDERSPHTKAYDQWLLLSLIGSTVADVARKERLTYDRVEGALERLLASEVNWDEVESLEILGLDEIALKKGHRDFVVPVTTRTSDGDLKLLALLPNRRRETVEEFLLQIPARLRRQVREVCTDMYEGYTSAVREALPQARIVVDRFHLAKAYRECADELRKEVQRELKAELSETEYEALKGTMWLFRRAHQDLDEEEKQRLELLFECAPNLKQAHQLREELTAIFETEQSKESGQAAIEDWQNRVRESGLRCFDSFLKTLGNWMDEITNYFVSRLTSGFVEGFNNKIKVLKRRCYGITNLKHLYQRLCLDLEGYRLFGF